MRVAERFPLWNAEHYTDGYFNPRGGWAEAGETVSFMAAEAQADGDRNTLRIHGSDVVDRLRTSGWDSFRRRRRGVQADAVLVAAGVWTPRLGAGDAGHDDAGSADAGVPASDSAGAVQAAVLPAMGR